MGCLMGDSIALIKIESTNANRLTWLEEASALLQLVQPEAQQSYVLRLILYKLQGEARSVAQNIPNPTWKTIRHILVTTFGVNETYGTLVNRIHENINIEIHFTSSKSHAGNSDKNRCHKTLLEQIRILIQTKSTSNISEQVLKAVEHYNNTIHSTIQTKPINVQYGKIEKSKLDKTLNDKKLKWIEYYNKTREPISEIENGKVYIINYETNNRQRFIIKTNTDNSIVTTKYNLNITKKDIETLTDNNWLNDQIVNFYLNLIADDNTKKLNQSKIHVMNTFLLPILKTSGYNAIKRWTRKVNIFLYGLIIIPAHQNNNHWTLAIIDLKNQTIKIYDSLGNNDGSTPKLLCEYLEKVSLDKLHNPFNTSNFTIVNEKNIPAQNNNNDCVVFVCTFAKYVAKNKTIKKRIILQIVQQSRDNKKYEPTD
ncbi:ubiquitin-like-specific protease ESD4 [Hermetia illucens]|uniref:ubiquitin-like-specific protease ESD4 n=1 Tax=Hermetia illucens TaxID=343691 RepID=UPI0018CC3003|nr:ubiquitin-like-specific protease ESD4 [Hermetia illucens]